MLRPVKLVQTTTANMGMNHHLFIGRGGDLSLPDPKTVSNFLFAVVGKISCRCPVAAFSVGSERVDEITVDFKNVTFICALDDEWLIFGD
jgi:hypothetical protein